MTHYYGGTQIHNHYHRSYHNIDYNRHYYDDEELKEIEEEKDIKNNLYGEEEYGTEIGIYECPECLECDTEYDYTMDQLWCYTCQDYLPTTHYTKDDINNMIEDEEEINSNKNENKSTKNNDEQKAFNFTD